MSDASQTQISFVAESTWGTTPSAALQKARVTSEGLKAITATVQSQELDPDRNVKGVVRTDFGAEGPLGVELAYGPHDPFLESALYNAFAAAESVTATDISFAASDNSANTSGGDFSDFAVGSWVKVVGTANNNGFRRVATAATGKLVFDRGTVVDESAGASMTIKNSGFATNGTTQKSLSIEKKFVDAGEFFSFTGMIANTASITIRPGAIIAGNFGFMGKAMAAGGATIGNGSYTAASSTEVMNAVDNISDVYEGGAATTLDLLEITININNNLRRQSKIGQLGARGIGAGQFNVTGTFQAYFESRTIVEKFLNDTDTSLSFAATDGAGNSYIFDMLNMSFTDAEVFATGNNEDVLATMPFSGKKDTVAGQTLAITKFDA